MATILLLVLLLAFPAVIAASVNAANRGRWDIVTACCLTNGAVAYGAVTLTFGSA